VLSPKGGVKSSSDSGGRVGEEEVDKRCGGARPDRLATASAGIDGRLGQTGSAGIGQGW